MGVGFLRVWGLPALSTSGALQPSRGQSVRSTPNFHGADQSTKTHKAPTARSSIKSQKSQTPSKPKRLPPQALLTKPLPPDPELIELEKTDAKAAQDP